ncbi:MAG: PH domain-containing protein [Acidobacteria bacterium]|nr:PH domain-containing protein [Acidobacteriota bacterium]NIM62485.1 PH domain-containing protein [Acidobacteriota bacterium]NIO58872.1 PH domain-containing protein [Acidobacteriota bacterium]NIQ29924.1 PH domain-containing protein [Acidobacteriota bacterium]NIQ84668.1 PH domain-containing protein [Acidobacteriota bacterium]
MPSEMLGQPQRLHPVSLLFTLWSFVRGMIVPLIVVIFLGGGTGYEFLFALAIVPAMIAAVVKYAFYRYRLGDDEMMVREGVLTRNERHIPYARIQNINLVQNPFHRALGVAEVHIETASGTKPEAIIRVLSLDRIDAIRELVFRDRAQGETVSAEGQEEGAERLLELSTRELVLLGLISNRGMVVIAAVMGVIWQFDVWDFDWEAIAKQAADRAPEVTERLGLVERQGLAASILLGALLIFVGVLFMKLLSILWALFRFHGFTLDRGVRNLRARYGLLTRYTAAIPSHRIQLLSSRTTPLYRLWNRVGVLAETAGGGTGNEGEGQSETHRLWLAPILSSGRADAFNHAILPDVDLSDATWNRLPVRARSRIRNRGFFLSAVISIATVAFLGWWSLAVLVVTFGWSALHAAMWWKHAAWTVVATAIAFRSGWWTRRTSIVRFAKIQTVSLAQTPFDRRHEMARVSIDTAGAGKAGHKIHVPFLPHAVAVELHERLALEAARRSFRW